VRNILVDRNLGPASFSKVVAHEFGHALDDLAGQIDTTDIKTELRQVYNDLNNPDLAMRRTMRPDFDPAQAGSAKYRNYGPEKSGYKGTDIDRELMAEAIRAYMADPNYLKTVAPRTAARIRAAVNANPRIAPIIQFNELLGLGATAAGAALLLGTDSQE